MPFSRKRLDPVGPIGSADADFISDDREPTTLFSRMAALHERFDAAVRGDPELAAPPSSTAEVEDLRALL